MPVSTNIINRKFNTGSELNDNDLHIINEHLSSLGPKEILEWAINYLPNLYQTTAFGLSGK
jgi:phosphoadenosine phosphosulfate reductase